MNRNGIVGRLHGVVEQVNDYLKELVDNENKEKGENNVAREYKLDIRERDMDIPIVVDGKVQGKRKKYYGTATISYIEGDHEYLVFREEYIFVNATERRRDFLWKERMCDKIIYEAMALLIVYGQRETPRIYDIENDRVMLSEEEQKDVSVTSTEDAPVELIQGKV